MKFLKYLLLTILIPLSASAQCIWTDNPAGPSCNIIPQTSGITLGSSRNPFGNIYGNITSSSSTFTDLAVTDDATVVGTTTSGNYLLTDGSDKNYNLSVYAAGTAYALTNTAAALDFGTTDPVLTINKAGTYLLIAKANLEYAGATFAANRNVTLKLRRTNNTAADLTGSPTVIGTNIVTTVSGVLVNDNLPAVIYTTALTNDAITIFGDVSTVPSAGALNATEASIVAVRLY